MFSSRIFLVLIFFLGLLPSLSFIHMFSKDSIIYFSLAESFRLYKAYSFQQLFGYGTTELGLQARAPLFPFLLALSQSVFGNNLLGAYLPLFIARILIAPLTFLVSKNFLPLPVAFFASSLIVFIPKLQTYSLSAFEADGFVCVFFLLSIYFYLQYHKSKNIYHLLLTGVSLGFLILTKELGLPISAGFIIAILVEKYFNKDNLFLSFKSFLVLILPLVIITLPFFTYTLIKDGNLYFSALTVDRNILYFPENIFILLKSVPYYFLGLDGDLLSNQTLRSIFINSTIITFFLIGLIYFVISRKLIFVLPIAFTLLSLSLLRTQSIGGNLPWNYELITILAFTMPIASIFIFKGMLLIVDLIFHKHHFFSKHKNLLYLFFASILLLKFVNNFFARPFTLDFSGDYYINGSTIILNRHDIPVFSFSRDIYGTLNLVNSQVFFTYMKNDYRNEKVIVFSKNFKTITTVLVFLGFCYGLLEQLLIRKKLKNSK
ncbi:MAG: hypothetical protein UT84_C0023G0002 [Candidatus Curtissbacteria bacterium GW2011_GWA1_40_16]|uniref:Glycosyltransferase RgtA/B/C/D-like domain-containing protein n=1 Tax=Candidatus Curtissbacteria bacterium GW2011_GWA1_40_16 TaxID=1618405 RepID=A0A0G0RA66_9BACT|nr:MAG: hypothetical protein UT84_C0023G0002 [Candidatus Curtissbacteria bacterium GW2011_GWA1_40_16]